MEANRETGFLRYNQPLYGTMLASSRGHCGGVRSRGRDKSRPYESILCFGPTGKMRRRMVLREGHGPPLQTGVSIEVNRETGFPRYNKPL